MRVAIALKDTHGTNKIYALEMTRWHVIRLTTQPKSVAKMKYMIATEPAKRHAKHTDKIVRPRRSRAWEIASAKQVSQEIKVVNVFWQIRQNVNF